MRYYLCDIDGVICDVRHRLEYAVKKDWDKYYDPFLTAKDPVITAGKNLLSTLAKDNKNTIILVTGRNEKTREDTIAWLKANGFGSIVNLVMNLEMRKKNDRRPSYETKVEIINEFIRSRRLLGAMENEREVSYCFIDDDPKNIIAVANSCPGVTCMLFGTDRLSE